MRARRRLAYASICSSVASIRSVTLMATRTPLIGFCRAVLLEHVEEGDPLVVVVVLGRVAARRVEEDGLVGEPPVAVARAADAAHAAAAARVEGREGEARLLERGRLSGARRADDHVPGQRVERAAAAGGSGRLCRSACRPCCICAWSSRISARRSGRALSACCSACLSRSRSSARAFSGRAKATRRRSSRRRGGRPGP